MSTEPQHKPILLAPPLILNDDVAALNNTQYDLAQKYRLADIIKSLACPDKRPDEIECGEYKREIGGLIITYVKTYAAEEICVTDKKYPSLSGLASEPVEVMRLRNYGGYGEATILQGTWIGEAEAHACNVPNPVAKDQLGVRKWHHGHDPD